MTPRTGARHDEGKGYRVRAMVYRGPYKVRVEDKDVPAIEHPNDAIVRVTLAAICGSDLHLYHGLMPDTRIGHTFGHEFIGVVERRGQGAEVVVGVHDPGVEHLTVPRRARGGQARHLAADGAGGQPRGSVPPQRPGGRRHHQIRGGAPVPGQQQGGTEQGPVFRAQEAAHLLGVAHPSSPVGPPTPVCACGRRRRRA